MFILPAHALKGVTGETFVKQFNYNMPPGTGPYQIREQDVERGRSIRIRRRNDYWAANHRRNIGTSNFDEVQQVVVRDRNRELRCSGAETSITTSCRAPRNGSRS